MTTEAKGIYRHPDPLEREITVPIGVRLKDIYQALELAGMAKTVANVKLVRDYLATTARSVALDALLDFPDYHEKCKEEPQ